MRKNYLISIIALVAIFSCEKEKFPVIELATDKITVSPQGEEISVKLKFNTDYTVTIPSKYSWIKQGEDSGVPGEELFIIQPGDKAGEREGMVIFSDVKKKVSDTLTITQGQLSAIDISQAVLDINFQASVFNINLMSNVEWEATTDNPEWIKIKDADSKASYESRVLEVSVEMNSSEEMRSGKIFITDPSGDVSDTLQVNQSGMKEYASFDEDIAGVYNNAGAVYVYEKYIKQFVVNRADDVITNRIYDPVKQSFISVSGVSALDDLEVGSNLTLSVLTYGIEEFSDYESVKVYVGKKQEKTLWLVAPRDVIYIFKK